MVRNLLTWPPGSTDRFHILSRAPYCGGASHGKCVHDDQDCCCGKPTNCCCSKFTDKATPEMPILELELLETGETHLMTPDATECEELDINCMCYYSDAYSPPNSGVGECFPGLPPGDKVLRFWFYCEEIKPGDCKDTLVRFEPGLVSCDPLLSTLELHPKSSPPCTCGNNVIPFFAEYGPWFMQDDPALPINECNCGSVNIQIRELIPSPAMGLKDYSGVLLPIHKKELEEIRSAERVSRLKELPSSVFNWLDN